MYVLSVIAFVILCTLLVLRMAIPLRISIERLKLTLSPDFPTFIAAIFLSLAILLFVFWPPLNRCLLIICCCWSSDSSKLAASS